MLLRIVSALLLIATVAVPGCSSGGGSAAVETDVTSIASLDQPPTILGPSATAQRMSARTRGNDGLDKLSRELHVLFEQVMAGPRQTPAVVYDEAQLIDLFAEPAPGPQSPVEVLVGLKDGASPAGLEELGFRAGVVFGTSVQVGLPISALGRLADHPDVASVKPVKAVHIPPQIVSDEFTEMTARPMPRGTESFDRQGLTGKGVIVGVVDTGIDWKHQDFLNPDGTTRILALWDFEDDSYNQSGGTIGQISMFTNLDGSSYGTVYLKSDIDRALKGSGTCNSKDVNGHGTACASTAAGNGRATANGVPAGTYAGVAPDAELLIVRAGDGPFRGNWVDGARWISRVAEQEQKPVVINLSLGGQYSAHDGTSASELIIDQLTGHDVPGNVICIAAGNEGRDSFHASGRFGAKSLGQADVQSRPIKLFVEQACDLNAYFHAGDNWGFGILGLDRFLFDTATGKPQKAHFQKVDADPQILLSENASWTEYESWTQSVEFGKTDGGQDMIVIPLKPGTYWVYGYGASDHVPDGAFDLYLPFTSGASFGMGTVKEKMVGSPGNSTDAITVGSYDFRSEWVSAIGLTTRYNFVLGDISDYSNPGYRRDGTVKPDVTSPGRYTISAAAAGSVMLKNAGAPQTTRDGYHLAWAGTSAATPYTAGVVALMLQKNRSLTGQQVKEILIRTATSDVFTGGVPNPVWGNGKINPAAAIRSTPTRLEMLQRKNEE